MEAFDLKHTEILQTVAYENINMAAYTAQKC